MNPRYTRPEMAQIWSDEHRYALWTRVEIAVCRAMARRGEIPQAAFETIEKRARVDPARVAEIEERVHHDVNAYLDALAEEVGPASRYVHLGLTSSDVLDTSLALQLRDAANLLLGELDNLLAVLKRRAIEHRDTVCVGRTHGIFAEPTTFGLKLLYAYDEMRRNRERLVNAQRAVAVGKASGAVGTFAHLSPDIEEEAMAELGLTPAPVSIQIVARDRHAEFMGTLAQIASSIERISIEMRHLARSEVREVQEFFGSEQKGSSAMPHKRNPWRFETLTGLSRVMRGYAQAALENQGLWHERDISNSSVERVICPDATTTLDFMLHRLTGLIEKLEVFPDRMRENLDSARGLVFSGAVLLALARHGLTRQQAYTLVQQHAMATWDEGGHLHDRIRDDPKVMKVLSADEVTACFDLDRQLANVERIFERTLAGTQESAA
jgi:adenylosuccinate lyase